MRTSRAPSDKPPSSRVSRSGPHARKNDGVAAADLEDFTDLHERVLRFMGAFSRT